MKVDSNRDEWSGRVSRAVLGLSMLTCIVVSSTGCRLCCDREDEAYPAYGGIWERTQRDSGRVGSLFEPGGARVSDLSPRPSAANDFDALKRMAPPNNGKNAESQDDPNQNAVEPQKKSEVETEQEFQERLKKFQEEEMLSAGIYSNDIVPGELRPPNLR